jgi:hydrogenase maturation protease
MTPGSPEAGRSAHLAHRDRGDTAPVLVVAVGNILLGDDGVGQRLLVELSSLAERWGGGVEFLDGGTQGMALLGFLVGRRAVVFLDAVALGAAPGTVHRLRNQEVLMVTPGAGMTAHETSAGELLRAVALVGELPPEVVVIGVEPASLETGMGLSPAVQGSVPAALRAAVGVLDGLASELVTGKHLA